MKEIGKKIERRDKVNLVFELAYMLVHAEGDVYEGQWSNGMANGEGIFIHESGAQYKGSWKNDMQDGEGYEVWPDGSTYKVKDLNKIRALTQWVKNMDRAN